VIDEQWGNNDRTIVAIESARTPAGVTLARLNDPNRGDYLSIAINGGADELKLAQIDTSITNLEIRFGDGNDLEFGDHQRQALPPIGNCRNDTLVGTVGNDRLYGYAGNDSLSGLNGHDLLDGAPVWTSCPAAWATTCSWSTIGRRRDRSGDEVSTSFKSGHQLRPSGEVEQLLPRAPRPSTEPATRSTIS
jgi:hypothetical protein